MKDLINVFSDISIKVSQCAPLHHHEVFLCSHSDIHVSYFMQKPESIVSSSKLTAGIRLVSGAKRSACISVLVSDDIFKKGGVLENALNAALSAISQSPEDVNTPITDVKLLNVEELDLNDPSQLDVNSAKKFALEMESSAHLFDAKISLVEQASFSSSQYEYLLASSNGLIGRYRKSISSASVSSIAKDQSSGDMENGYAFDVNCKSSRLKAPSDIGQEASERAIKRLGSSVLKSGTYPIIIEQRIAGDFLSGFVSAINGSAISSGGSFLVNKMGHTIFNTGINIIDDSSIKSGLFSKPFDGEGFQAMKNVLVDNGVLENIILDLYYANKLNMKSTRNACRSIDASIYPSATNLYIENSNTSTDLLIADIKNGIYVTELIGFGVNIATGDYSQGASGFMIENGKITNPIHGITIAGNLSDLFKTMYVGNDLKMLGKINSPSIFIPAIIVAGA